GPPAGERAPELERTRVEVHNAHHLRVRRQSLASEERGKGSLISVARQQQVAGERSVPSRQELEAVRQLGLEAPAEITFQHPPRTQYQRDIGTRIRQT